MSVAKQAEHQILSVRAHLDRQRGLGDQSLSTAPDNPGVEQAPAIGIQDEVGMLIGSNFPLRV